MTGTGSGSCPQCHCGTGFAVSRRLEPGRSKICTEWECGGLRSISWTLANFSTMKEGELVWPFAQARRKQQHQPLVMQSFA